MKKKIIVAGAGHGGLVVAANLAKNDFDVTIIEKQKESEMGFDWHDSMRPASLEIAGIPPIDEKEYSPSLKMSYSNPKLTVKLVADKQNPNVVFVDRKVLIKHLISFAKECGVKFVFETNILGAIYNSDSVCGIEIEKDGKREKLYADLVVDAAGMFSPVRQSLPGCFGVEKYADPKDVFCVWRGYFNKTENKVSDPAYNIYFYHCKNPGMDWMITNEDSMDVLIGGFGSLSEKNIDDAIADFKKQYPYMGDEIIRGGIVEKIPLGKMLPVLVCNGYAAVGNSGMMTEPLSGSGIDLSIKAGKILADTILESKGDYSVYNLWKYNYQYFKKFAQKYYNDLIIKNFLSTLNSDEIDFFMEKRIMTEKEIAGDSGAYSINDLLDKLQVVRKPKLLLALADVVKKFALAEAAKSMIPEKYDSNKIKSWTNIYKYL